MSTLNEFVERVVAAAHSLERSVAEASLPDGRSAAREVSELAEADLMAVLSAFGAVRTASTLGLAALTAEVSARSGVARGANSMAKREGHSSATELAAAVLDITPTEANTLIRVGHATRAVVASSGEVHAPRYPLVQAALTDGRLRFMPADVITKCLDGLGPIASTEQRQNLEAQLVSAAARVGLADLKIMCAEARALLDPQSLLRREAEQRKNRALTMFVRDDGMLQIKILLPPAEGQLFRGAVHSMFHQLGTVAPETATRPWGPRAGEPQPYPATASAELDRPDGTTGDQLLAPAGSRFDREGRPLDADATLFVQLLADALLSYVSHGSRCAHTGEDGSTIPSTQLIIRVNYDDLVNGISADGTAAFGHIDGHSEPVSIEQIRHLATAAEVIPAVMNGQSEVLDFGRAKRWFSRSQRLALIERDGGCAFPGCDSPPSFSDVHHIRWWERDHGPTDLSNGIVLCSSHHHRIHDQGWQISIHPPVDQPDSQPQAPPIPHFVAPKNAYAAADIPGARTLPDGRIEIPGGRVSLVRTLHQTHILARAS